MGSKLPSIIKEIPSFDAFTSECLEIVGFKSITDFSNSDLLLVSKFKEFSINTSSFSEDLLTSSIAGTLDSFFTLWSLSSLFCFNLFINPSKFTL